MNCREFEMNVRTLARSDSALSEDLAHVADCSKCADLLAGEQALVTGFRAVTQQLALEEAPARMEALLLDAFRRNANAVSFRSSHLVVAGYASVRSALAAAAVMLSISVLLLVAWDVRRISFSPEAFIPAVTLESPQQKISFAPVTVKSEAPVARRTVARRRQAPMPTARVDEIVTEFFPLTDSADSMRIAEVMRVELPASAMVNVGLPVAEEELKKPITADIALGDDGIARAIRFVKTADR